MTSPYYNNVPSPPEKKKHTVLWVLLSILGFFVATCLVGVIAVAVGEDSPQGGNVGIPPVVEDTGSRDGKFEFTINKVSSAKHIGGEFGDTAQGEYVIVNVTVANIGDEGQAFDSGSQYAYDSKDRRYETDGVAQMSDLDSNSLWYNDINPGNSVTGDLIFDVPEGTDLVKVELHDSMFSGGVTIKL